MQTVDIRIENGEWKLLKSIRYRGIYIKKGTVSDGGTIKYIASAIFSNKDINQGAFAFFIHDHLAENKDKYTLLESTDILVNLWVENGLNRWKGHCVKFFVNTYFKLTRNWK